MSIYRYHLSYEVGNSGKTAVKVANSNDFFHGILMKENGNMENSENSENSENRLFSSINGKTCMYQWKNLA